MVAMELMASDVAAARGFLLSARGMLPGEFTGPLRGAHNDADLELAALELLTPGTRARYEATVPLLSRRAASGAAQRRDPDGAASLGDPRDFELLGARPAGRSRSGHAAICFDRAGARAGWRDDAGNDRRRRRPARSEPARGLPGFIRRKCRSAPGTRRTACSVPHRGDRRPPADAAAFDNASAAFRRAVNGPGLAALKVTLGEIGTMSESASLAGTAALLTHASALADMPRLHLVARAAGDRAAAAAKRLPRDGRLLDAARGELIMTRDLVAALAVASIAALGLLSALGFKLFQIGRRMSAPYARRRI